MLSNESSSILNYLKCLLCIGVVFIHALYFPDVVTAIGRGQLNDYSNYITFDQIFRKDFLDNTCVPLFFSISGYLFFINTANIFNKEIYVKKLKTRFKSLVVPYLIANLLMLSVVVAIGGVHSKIIGFSSSISALWAYNGTTEPIDCPTWYIRDLVVVCLFTPLLYQIIKYTGMLLSVVLGVFWIFDLWFLSIPGFGITSFLFFTIGSYFGMKEFDVIKKLNIKKYGWLYLVVFLVVFFAYQILGYQYLLKLSVIASFPLWISMAKVISEIISRPCPKRMVTETFFIFLFHFSIAHRVPVLLTKVLGISEVSVFVCYILGAIFTALGLFCIYMLLNKLLPQITSVLVGGR